MKTCLTFLVSLYCLSAGAQTKQIKIWTDDLHESYDSILFDQFPNHITVENTAYYKTVVHTSNAPVMAIGNNRFVITPIDKQKPVTVTVVDHGSKKPRSFVKTFSVESLGDTSVRFLNLADTLDILEHRVNYSRLQLSFSNPRFEGNYEVAHFELTIKDAAGNEKISRQFISGHYLGLGLTDFLKTMKGGTVFFDNIVLKGHDTRYTQVRSFTVQL